MVVASVSTHYSADLLLLIVFLFGWLLCNKHGFNIGLLHFLFVCHSRLDMLLGGSSLMNSFSFDSVTSVGSLSLGASSLSFNASEWRLIEFCRLNKGDAHILVKSKAKVENELNPGVSEWAFWVDGQCMPRWWIRLLHPKQYRILLVSHAWRV